MSSKINANLCIQTQNPMQNLFPTTLSIPKNTTTESLIRYPDTEVGIKTIMG